MAALFGPVLTHADSAETFLRYYRAGNFSAAKVVTGWGLSGGWTEDARKALTYNVPRLIIRSTFGDPSYAGGQRAWPLPDALVEEFAPWVALNPNAWLEIGNEPDVVQEQQPELGEMAIWLYRYWLAEAEAKLRKAFPLAKLIGPSPRIGPAGWQRWLEIPADVLRRFDTMSVHLYGWHRIYDDGKGEYRDATATYNRLFPNKSIAVTEMGVHDPATPKAKKLDIYRTFARTAPPQWRWVMFYHYDQHAGLHPEYVIPTEAFTA